MLDLGPRVRKVKELVRVLKMMTFPRTEVAGFCTRRGRKSKVCSGGGYGRGLSIAAGGAVGDFWIVGGGEEVAVLDMAGVVGGEDSGVVEGSLGERRRATVSENCRDIL